MKIALAQLNYHIANFDDNTQKVVEAILQAKKNQADIIVFAELAIGGYPAKDLLQNEVFLQRCEAAVDEIATHTKEITVIIGAPVRNTHSEGKALFNAALVIEDGQVVKTARKRFLPDYDVFDEYRYFQPYTQTAFFPWKQHKIALTICEDLWDNDTDNSYVGDIWEDFAYEKPDLIFNIAASPFSYTHFETRVETLRRSALKINAPIVYVNQIGGHTDILFDGRSFAMDKNGDIVLELNAFEEDLRYLELEDTLLTPPAPRDAPTVVDSEIARIHQALVFGIRDYFHKSGFKKAVLGLSGGIDSAVVAALAAEALGADNVLSILLPSKYSSDHSIQDAVDLVNNIQGQHRIVSIEKMVEGFDAGLADLFDGLKADLTEENIQARIRATVLMAAANKLGYILLNTSNKSEAAVGYGTLYGDMAGAISVIGDVYKTQVYQLAEYINRDREIIPHNTIHKAPSAELRPDQKDSDSLPPYDLLDAVLFHYIENGKATSEIIPLGFDQALVQRIVKLVNNAEFKRFQAPPILRVSPKAFGPGRAMPLVAKYDF